MISCPMAEKEAQQCLGWAQHYLRLGWLALAYWRNEPVAPSWNRDDVTVFSSFFTERAAQRGNALVQVVLFDSSFGPNCPHECFFAENHVGMLHQINERVECLRCQG